jgi:transcriptional regulator with XRE-family HTH domain
MLVGVACSVSATLFVVKVLHVGEDFFSSAAPSAHQTVGSVPCGRRAGKMWVVNDTSSKAALEALGALLRAQRISASMSLRELSALTNVSNAYLSELERGLHEPSLRVLRAIASALGTSLGATLASAGMLGENERNEDQARVGETEAAILRDPQLSEPQRVALLSVYRSFVHVPNL